MSSRWTVSAQTRSAACGGFTYLGVLLLVALIGTALTVVSELWHTAQKRDKEAELLFVGDQFRRAITAYSAAAAGAPQSLDDLLKDPRFPEPRRYLRKLYVDPMTGKSEWGIVKGAGNSVVGVHSLSNEEPLKKKEFSLADSAFEGKTKYSEWVFASRTAGSPGTTPAPAGTNASATSGTSAPGAIPPQASASQPVIRK